MQIAASFPSTLNFPLKVKIQYKQSSIIFLFLSTTRTKCQEILSLNFIPPDRDGVFICKIFVPPSRDLGINKWDLGKVGWLACHTNTFCFSMRFLRIAKSRLAETARPSGTARLHMIRPLNIQIEFFLSMHCLHLWS